jgi:hypothetical protein
LCGVDDPVAVLVTPGETEGVTSHGGAVEHVTHREIGVAAAVFAVAFRRAG